MLSLYCAWLSQSLVWNAACCASSHVWNVPRAGMSDAGNGTVKLQHLLSPLLLVFGPGLAVGRRRSTPTTVPGHFMSMRQSETKG